MPSDEDIRAALWVDHRKGAAEKEQRNEQLKMMAAFIASGLCGRFTPDEVAVHAVDIAQRICNLVDQ